MKIEDNFLDQKVFDDLQPFMMGHDFPWFYQDAIDHVNQLDKFMFATRLYLHDVPCSPYFEDLKTTFFKKLNLISIYRIKANLLTRTPNIVENEFHIDIAGIREEILKQLTTSIFYVNTNNGYTIFEDGTKVESIANRIVTFPANTKHTGTSCTDEKIRIVINFNYFK